jgi:transposase-like protein
MITCPHCQDNEQQVKVGFTGSGSQRYLCKVCQRQYTPLPKEHIYSEAVRRQALELYVDGLNFRRIERVLGVSRQSVANWAQELAGGLPATPPAPTAPLAVNELDELFTFVGHKKTKSTSSRK